MKKYKEAIFSNLFLIIVMYTCGVIASASFYPFDWNPITRTTVSIFYGFFCFVINITFLHEKDNTKNKTNSLKK